MTEMNCQRVRELLSDHLEGSLPERDALDLTEHIGRCPGCAAEADGLRATVALLKGLPARKAPPELMTRVLAAVAHEQKPRRPLWRVLFLPVHVKIPLEAAAAAVLFALVFGLPGGTPTREPLPAPPMRLAEAPAPPVAAQAETADRAAEPRLPAARREPAARRRETAAAVPLRPAAEAQVERTLEPQREPLALPRAPAAPEGLPPAMFASTEGKRVTMAVGGPEEPLGKAGAPAAGGAAAPFVLAAPPSRLGKGLPYGREVLLEIRAEDGGNVEEKIAAAAARLGGAHRRTPAGPGAARAETAAAPPVVRVEVPAPRAEEFLRELRTLGTIPPEGAPGWADFPAGPSPDVVAFTVRVRVR